jgi:hypothetical protein
MKTVGLGQKLKNPVAAAVLAGVEVAGTAVAFGVAETLLGLAAAYVAFQALDRRGASSSGAGDAAAGMELRED